MEIMYNKNDVMELTEGNIDVEPINKVGKINLSKGSKIILRNTIGKYDSFIFAQIDGHNKDQICLRMADINSFKKIN